MSSQIELTNRTEKSVKSLLYLIDFPNSTKRLANFEFLHPTSVSSGRIPTGGL